MSSSSFDAVVPDILTFRPDKDDPLDMGNQQISEEEVSTPANKKKLAATKKIEEKRMELITAVVSAIASWNINEAFEEVCCKSLRLSKGISQNISYGLKG
jgi:uncharacterized membrane protein YebE (DUF533 family)